MDGGPLEPGADVTVDSRFRGNDGQKKAGGIATGLFRITQDDDQFGTTVTARRFWAQLASSEPVATGRSLP
jgi:hypothetical protein